MGRRPGPVLTEVRLDRRALLRGRPTKVARRSRPITEVGPRSQRSSSARRKFLSKGISAGSIAAGSAEGPPTGRFPGRPGTLGNDRQSAPQARLTGNSGFPANFLAPPRISGGRRVHTPMRHFRSLMRQKRAIRKPLQDHGFSSHWRLGVASGCKTAAKPPISGAKSRFSGAHMTHIRATWRVVGFANCGGLQIFLRIFGRVR